ncbi:MAG: sensor histidine kinase [Pseudomonadota bacterium]
MTAIRTKLFLGLLIPLALVAGLVSLETFFSAQRTSQDLNDRTLLAAGLAILEGVVATDGTLLADEALDALTEQLGDRYFYHVRGPNGAFVTGYSGFPKPPNGDAGSVVEPIFYDAMHLGAPVRAVQFQRDLSDRVLNGATTITAWQRIDQRTALTLQLFSLSLARLSLLVLAAGTIVWFAVSWGLRPLQDLQDAIEKRSSHDLTQIQRKVPKELAGIVGSMNDLFARVARSKHNRERFIGDAAHQLRNPVAAIKVQAQAALDQESANDERQALKSIVAVADSSALMINQMLSGAKAYTLNRSTQPIFKLQAMLERVISDMAPLAFDGGHDVSAHMDSKKMSVQGSQALIGEAVRNLIDNAIRHTAPGMIRIELSREGTNAIISVADDGDALEDKEFDELTQPFHTRSANDEGTGLGLSVAKDVAKSHGGRLELKRTGNGKAIQMILPLSA